MYLFASIITTNEQEANDYMGAIINKHYRIEHIREPKLIFAGGSNLAFGINSSKIEKELSIPVVNLGLHAGLGLSFMLKELEYSCRAGDVVFISPEYFLSLDGEYKLKKHTKAIYNIAGKFYNVNVVDETNLHIEKTRSNIKSFTIKRQKQNDNLSQRKDSLYYREGFNEYGDVISHLDRPQPKKLIGKNKLAYTYWGGISILNEFAIYAKKNNIRVFFIYPTYPKSEYRINKRSIVRYADDLSSNLKMEIIGQPDDFVFDDALFFDTIYHLNAVGREIRTDKLIDVIRDKVL